MAEWSRKKVNSGNINNGKEYEKDDNVVLEQLNAMLNTGFYAQDFAEKLVTNIDTSEVGNVGTPSVSLITGDGATADKPYKKFKFSNLKGEQGIQGIQGENALCTNKVETQDYQVGTGIFNKWQTMFNRKPIIGETFLQRTKTYLALFEIMDVVDSDCAYKCIANTEVKGDKGEKGDTGATGNGIISISKTGTSKLVDTYTISFTSGATTTFQITNGKGITKIEKTATSGLVDTYTITFNDATTSTFQVTNGAKGEKGDKGDTGATPNITATATTLPAGSSATVTKSGTAENPAFAFGIPKGDKGDKGDAGVTIYYDETTNTLTINNT